ncbi:MAG: PD-(D/E)XK nuclease family protein [Alphaproteobacteria bacterium]|nr:PD-(D/E)XK nuclease family protein [Alphaproteobacteria bacterium]
MMEYAAQKTPISLLAERDMDLIFIEEISVSKPFRDWIIAKLYNGSRSCVEFLGAYHTFRQDPLGTVDIMMTFKDISGRRCAILIENKIDQPKQNLQAQRYFEFGEQGLKQGRWDEYLTCLFSPQAYFSTLEPSEYFSSYLSYEELVMWFMNSASTGSISQERALYKSKIIQLAIEQNTGMTAQTSGQTFGTTVPNAPVAPVTPQAMINSQSNIAPISNITQMNIPFEQEAAIQNNKQQIIDDLPIAQEANIQPINFEEPQNLTPAQNTTQTSLKTSSLSDFRVFPGGVFNLPPGYREAEDTIKGQFWNDCLLYATKKYPDLGMKKPSGSAGEASWVEMTPEKFPHEVKIIHKMPQGYMDLTFAMTPLEMIQKPYQRFIDNDMEFKESGKSAIIRITIPPIDPQEGFEKQKDLITFAFTKAYKLYQLYIHVVGI